MTISSQGASIRDTAGHGECDFAYLATVLEAFATVFQSAHEDRQSLSLTWQGRSIAPFPMRKWKSPPTALPLLARPCMLA